MTCNKHLISIMFFFHEGAVLGATLRHTSGAVGGVETKILDQS
jgi:hypothetical protein